MFYNITTTRKTPIVSSRRTRRRRGSIVLIVASSITVILGFTAIAVDYGLLVNDANRLQRACDAAALAGASELRATANMSTNKTNATSVAQVVFAQNGFSAANCTVNPIDHTNPNDTNPINPTQIKVTGVTIRKFLFIVDPKGLKQGQVIRAAVAQIKGGNGNRNAAPLGITEETHNYWKNQPNYPLVPITLIRQNKQTFNQTLKADKTPLEDPFVLFDLRAPNGKSGEHMARQLTGAEPAISQIDDLETTLNSDGNSERNKLEDGIETLFQKSAGTPWNDAWGGDWLSNNSTGTKSSAIINSLSPRSNPRVLNIVVTPKVLSPQNGTFNTRVSGIAPVYVEKVTKEEVGGEEVYQLWVRFLPPSSGGGSTTTSVDPAQGAEGGGGFMISLVQ